MSRFTRDEVIQPKAKFALANLTDKNVDEL